MRSGVFYMPKRKTILVVESNRKDLRLCRDLLELRGHDVMEAVDGLEGISMARLHRPDLILMDVALPLMSGEEALSILGSKPETKNIPVIAFTGFAMKGDKERFLKLGFDGYIAKPVDTRKFVPQMEEYLRRPRKT